MNRTELTAVTSLEQQFDVAKMSASYDDVMRIFHDYLQQQLLTNAMFKKLNISVAAQVLSLQLYQKMRAYLAGEIGGKVLTKYRIAAWVECDKHISPDSDLFRLMVCGMYAKTAWQASLASAQDDGLALLLHLVFKLDDSLCAPFAQFVAAHPNALKFKYA